MAVWKPVEQTALKLVLQVRWHLPEGLCWLRWVLMNDWINMQDFVSHHLCYNTRAIPKLCVRNLQPGKTTSLPIYTPLLQGSVSSQCFLLTIERTLNTVLGTTMARSLFKHQSAYLSSFHDRLLETQSITWGNSMAGTHRSSGRNGQYGTSLGRLDMTGSSSKHLLDLYPGVGTPFDMIS